MKTFSAAAAYTISVSFAMATLPALGGDKAPTWQNVKPILERSCIACHGNPANPVTGYFGSATDLDALKAKGIIVPGDASQSRLYQRLKSPDAPMPPKTGGQPDVTAADKDLIRDWINAGAKSDDVKSDDPESGSSDAIAAVKNYNSLPDRVKPYALYFSLSEIVKTNSGTNADAAFRALTKAVNFLSTRPGLVIPTQVTPTLARIDIRHTGWTLPTWSDFMSTNPYPVPVTTESAWLLNRIFARGDWFLAKALRGEAYFRFLDMPGTYDEVLARFGYETLREPETRMGFATSGPEANNRIVTRSATRRRFGATKSGAVYKSYNFAANTWKDRGNVFQFPTGPGKGPYDFHAADSDIILTLPNGLHAYFTVTPEGILDAEANAETGLRCLSCHAGGFVPRQDEIRPSFLARRGEVPQDLLAAVMRLYPDNARIQATFENDNETFESAMRDMGFESPKTMADPITVIVRRYDRAATRAEVAAEFNTSETELVSAIRSVPELSASLGSLLLPSNASVRRDLLEEQAGLLMQALAGATPNEPLRRTGYSPRLPRAADQPLQIGDDVYVADAATQFAKAVVVEAPLAGQVRVQLTDVKVPYILHSTPDTFFIAVSQARKAVEQTGGIRVGQSVRLRSQSGDDFMSGTVEAADVTGRIRVNFGICRDAFEGPVAEVVGLVDTIGGFRVGDRVCVAGALPEVQLLDPGTIRLLDSDGTATVEMDGLRRPTFRGSVSVLKPCDR